jgi:hypothetical protein
MLSCAIALGAIGCGSEEPSATEATEPETSATTGSEAPVAEAPAPAPAPAPEPAAPPEPATPAAQPAPEPQMPPSAVIVTHKVKDFAAWKTAFDADEANRKNAGFMMHALMTDVNNPKNVSVYLPTADLAKAEAMTSSEELKKTMKDAGVIGKPTVQQINHAGSSTPTGKMAKYGAMLDLKVKDYAAWRTVFDGAQQLRTDNAISAWSIGQDPKDPNHVLVWLESDDKDKLTAFTKSKELKAKDKEGGIKGAAKVSVWETSEMKQYQ